MGRRTAERAVRIALTVPGSLRARMAAHESKANWSAIATAAIAAEVERLEREQAWRDAHPGASEFSGEMLLRL